MTNVNVAKQLALKAAAAKNLIQCEVESQSEQSDGSIRIVVAGSLDIDVEDAVQAGHNRDDVGSLISNMRLQVDVINGQVKHAEWLR
jgi:hypothetical protein